MRRLCSGWSSGHRGMETGNGLSEFQQVHIVSDGFSKARLDQAAESSESLTLECLRRPRFRSLRRFGHLTSELVWICLLVLYTSRYLEALEGSIQGKIVRPVVVICHSHPVAPLSSAARLWMAWGWPFTCSSRVAGQTLMCSSLSLLKVCRGGTAPVALEIEKVIRAF